MKCYNHPEKHGVAICKSCGKSLCIECLHESGAGIACNQESCINALSQKNKLHTMLAEHLQNMKRVNILGSLFSIGMGIVFMYFSSRGYGLVYDFIYLLGIGFIVYGAMAQFVNMIIFFKKRRNKKY